VPLFSPYRYVALLPYVRSGDRTYAGECSTSSIVSVPLGVYVACASIQPTRASKSRSVSSRIVLSSGTDRSCVTRSITGHQGGSCNLYRLADVNARSVEREKLVLVEKQYCSLPSQLAATEFSVVRELDLLIPL
jgi:hypothetical protein